MLARSGISGAAAKSILTALGGASLSWRSRVGVAAVLRSKRFHSVDSGLKSRASWWGRLIPSAPAASPPVTWTLGSAAPPHASATLTRTPRDGELDYLLKYVESKPNKTQRQQAYAEVFWGILNSPEFVLSR